MIIRDGLCTLCAFTTWTSLQAWFNPLTQTWFGDPEITNWFFRFTLPLCFIALVYNVNKYYNRKEKLLQS
jgi:hypothetical protein